MLETLETNYVGRDETHFVNKFESLSWIYTYFNTDYVKKIEQWFYSLCFLRGTWAYLWLWFEQKLKKQCFVFTHNIHSSTLKTTCPFPVQGHTLLEPVTIGRGCSPPLSLLCKWFPVHHGQTHSHSQSHQFRAPIYPDLLVRGQWEGNGAPGGTTLPPYKLYKHIEKSQSVYGWQY